MNRKYFGPIIGNMIARHISAQAKKPVIVVIGAGWGGYRCAHDLDKSKFDVITISPRNHFLFTPLLPSTAVGTLEFRAIQEPVRTIPRLHYFQANVNSVDVENSSLMCTDAFKKDSHTFAVKYDALIFATGSETNTFGVPGVYDNENVFFLKQLSDARGIRNRLVDCFERASSPGASMDEIKKLLRFIVVGGGPTNVEFASELYDFLKEDVTRMYPDLYQHCEVVMVEASGHVLGSFKATLVNYVEKLFRTRRIDVRTNTSVKAVNNDVVELSNGEKLPFGLMVWSTGVKQVKLIQELDNSKFGKGPGGRILVDDRLRVISPDGREKDGAVTMRTPIFALGDCAADKSHPLPALAQVALQQGKFLAKTLNKYGLEETWKAQGKPFSYHHLGMMASVGQWKGVWDAGLNVHTTNKGFLAFLLWRSAYWTKQVSLTNKLLIPMHWFKTMLFGRDISRF